MTRYKIQSTVIIEHYLDADDPLSAREFAWLWALKLPANHEVITHAIFHHPVLSQEAPTMNKKRIIVQVDVGSNTPDSIMELIRSNMEVYGWAVLRAALDFKDRMPSNPNVSVQANVASLEDDEVPQ